MGVQTTEEILDVAERHTVAEELTAALKEE